MPLGTEMRLSSGDERGEVTQKKTIGSAADLPPRYTTVLAL